MSSTEAHDTTPAKKPESADLIPCQWSGCRFAFDRNVTRWDVRCDRDFARPVIDNGSCLVPECGMYIPNDVDEGGLDLKRVAELFNYCLSTEEASTEEFNQRHDRYDETEDRLREAAARIDERADIIQLEVAGTTILLTQREAALVVYCPEEWAGFEVTCERRSAWTFNRVYPLFELSATVIGRPLGEHTVYAAVFPRIRPISFTGWHEGLRNAPCNVKAKRECSDLLAGMSKSMYMQKVSEGHCELFLGNVTEVDWTNRLSADREKS